MPPKPSRPQVPPLTRSSGQLDVRLGEPGDAVQIGRLLDAFNREFGEPTPGPRKLAERVGALITEDELTVLLAGEGPDGLAVLRFRPAIWSEALECYLAELYVVPARRGRGLGRALMLAALEAARARGADTIELGTSDSDVAARALYESLGFSNLEGDPPGSVMYFYEREL
ncbi:MAG TPA: GNAT family N-acetyltransferase [Solirubrobacteraceae bacterium]|jgi:ribosomal protein S18 acetylase RimI-like enzyme|nr:GNAT family N-acetyltransferase [Solirubrobacteraceae bacterium]